MTELLACAMVWRPDEQKRFTVTPETVSGMPAFIAMARAMFMPCGPSGKAQPSTRSSMTSFLSPGTRSIAPLTATVPRYSGRTSRRAPFFALPTGVRTEETI